MDGLVSTDHIRLQEVLGELGKVERQLYRRYRIRLRVDKVSHDGRSALCSAAQVRRRFLRADHTSYEVVETCHEALEPLRIIGVMPLIEWLPRQKSNTFMKIDPKDPFRVLWALARTVNGQVGVPAEPAIMSFSPVENHDAAGPEPGRRAPEQAVEDKVGNGF
jgi:hypothetical protein